ncbi:hypothetical protein Scep_024510 [Stephania cephalantha]|uniref:acireductone dioxygenase (Fe(2+)-requiring) n=1 Tax=Stephania cephalantha TaxID=152367 RepID=A0AAP0EWP4_9MAGN
MPRPGGAKNPRFLLPAGRGTGQNLALPRGARRGRNSREFEAPKLDEPVDNANMVSSSVKDLYVHCFPIDGLFSQLVVVAVANCDALDPREEVIQAWYMDDSNEDQRLPHHRDPKEFVSLDRLDELGVLSWRLDADKYETDEVLKKIREERGYSYMDFCEVCPEKLPNYEEKIKNFFEEHLHTDEEIRYCVAGSGYFDVRDKNDGWIRAMRLFVGDPVWTPFNRPHDDLPARKEYLEAFVNNGVTNLVVDANA